MKHSSIWSELVWGRQNLLTRDNYQQAQFYWTVARKGSISTKKNSQSRRTVLSVFRFPVGDKQSSNAQIHFRGTNVIKNHWQAIKEQLKNLWLSNFISTVIFELADRRIKIKVNSVWVMFWYNRTYMAVIGKRVQTTEKLKTLVNKGKQELQGD